MQSFMPSQPCSLDISSVLVNFPSTPFSIHQLTTNHYSFSCRSFSFFYFSLQENLKFLSNGIANIIQEDLFGDSGLRGLLWFEFHDKGKISYSLVLLIGEISDGVSAQISTHARFIL